MHIIITGAGIAGLSTYLALRKHLPADGKHTVVIYEAHDLKPYIAALLTYPTSSSSNRRISDDSKHGRTQADLSVQLGAEAEAEADRPAAFTPEVIGSAIGISLNGLNVLSRLAQHSPSDDDDGDGGSKGRQLMMEHLLRVSHPVHTWRMAAARGWKLLDVAMVPKSAQKDGDRGVTGIMISRQGFWQVLLAEVLRVVEKDAESGGIARVLKQGRLKAIVWPDARSKSAASETQDDEEYDGMVEVIFEDGRREKADLVIGADGVRSGVRKAMFECGTQHHAALISVTQPAKTHGGGTVPTSQTTSAKGGGFLGWLQSFWRSDTSSEISCGHPNYVAPNYEGLVGVGGFIPASVLQNAHPAHQPSTMGLVFGRNGFFGYGYITTLPTAIPERPTLANMSKQLEPGTIGVWWSTFPSQEENPYPVMSKEVDGKTRKRPSPWDFDHDEALSALLARHRVWRDPTVKAIMDYVESPPDGSNKEKGHAVEGLYPTWTTPLLNTWHHGPVVLVGDAAHALQSSSGQGACQALEDAETLGICLGHFLKRRDTENAVSVSVTVEQAILSFEKARMPRVKDIYDRSQRMSRMKGEMGIVMEMTMYAMFKLIGMIGRLLPNSSMEQLLAYDLPREVQKVLESDVQ